MRGVRNLGNEIPNNIEEWLAELMVAGEAECTSILYAKSLLDITEQQQLSMAPYRYQNQAQQVRIGDKSSLVQVKPQRCIARMMSSSSEHIMTASTPNPIISREKYRTTMQFKLGDAQLISPSAPTIPYHSCYSEAPISAFIRIQPNKNATNNLENSDNTVPVKSECDCITCNISSKIPGAPTVALRGATVASRVRHRSLTPKFSSRGRFHRRLLCHRPQKSNRLQLQQQKQQQSANKTDSRRNDGMQKDGNEIVVGDELLSDTSLCSLAEASLKLDTDRQWTADNEIVDVLSDQNRNLTCSSSQPNLFNVSSAHHVHQIDSADECEIVYAKQSDCFQLKDSDGLVNYSKHSFPRRNLPPPVLPSTERKKPTKATNSLQKKVTTRRRSDLADNSERSPFPCAEQICIGRKPPKYSQNLQLQIFRVNGQTMSQVLMNASSSSPRMTRSLTNNSNCSGNDNDGTFASTLTTTMATGTVMACESNDSSSNSSIDSGQGSTEFNSQNCSSKDPFDCDRSFSGNDLPSYVRMANTIDHALRMCSALHTVLNDEIDETWSNELICKAKVLIDTLQHSPCSTFLPNQDIAKVQQMIFDLKSERNCTARPVAASNSLIVMLRKVVQEILLIFAKIISTYLGECTSQDRLLVIALEHLIHLMLFGDELCLVIVKSGGLDSILFFCEMPSTPNGTLRLLLRALAVLCGNYRGALKLLALGTLELILRLLYTSSIACSAEAAGVLTQLTSPIQNYVRLGSAMPKVVMRILEIVDESNSAEPLLLAVAALANITVQETKATDLLYEHNAIKRLVQAYKRPKCCSIFVQEQLLTVFTYLANGAYIEALIGQGAVPTLFSMLKARDSVHANYCKRIQLRAAQCLRTIAGHGIGLKAIHEMNGYSVTTEVIRDNNTTKDAKSTLWWIRERLEQKYHLESAV